jgi:hypothetical protein
LRRSRLVSEVRFFEVHLHHRAAVKGWDKQQLITSEKGLQAQLEVTVSAYRRPLLSAIL